MAQSYKDLIVWKKAMTLVMEVYQVSRKFPRDEIYGLTSQIRRAAVSIPSNIAEGQGRRTPAEFDQFPGQVGVPSVNWKHRYRSPKIWVFWSLEKLGLWSAVLPKLGSC